MEEQENKSVYNLKLFTAGYTPSSFRVMTSLKKTVEEKFKGKFELEVIDILENPELAEKFSVIATPTLLILYGGRKRMIIGDLSNPEKVILDLFEESIPES